MGRYCETTQCSECKSQTCLAFEFLNAHLWITTCKMYTVFDEMSETHYTEAFASFKNITCPKTLYIKLAGSNCQNSTVVAMKPAALCYLTLHQLQVNNEQDDRHVSRSGSQRPQKILALFVRYIQGLGQMQFKLAG